MLMATLRDTENALFPVSHDSGYFVMGFTTPWEMKGWTYEILGYSSVEYKSTSFCGEFDALRKTESVRILGGVAFLLIHSAMLGKPAPFISYPNHWVSFLGNLNIKNGVWYKWKSGHLRFDCYTWGDKKNPDIDKELFKDYMWGVVTGKQ